MGWTRRRGRRAAALAAGGVIAGLGAIVGCSSGGSSVPAADAGYGTASLDAATPALDGGTGAVSTIQPGNPDGGVMPPPDAGNPAVLRVKALQMPASSGGTVPLVALIDGVRVPPVQTTVEVSKDGTTFGPATVSRATFSSDGATGGQAALTWDAVQDLGLRAVGTYRLRVTPADGAGVGQTAEFTISIDNLRAAARRVAHYIANYGSWSSDALALAQHTDLVIAHPGNANLSRSDIQRMQAGADPNDPHDDVLVLCYVSVGEDLRTHALSDDQVRADPRFRGDGTGPRIDPRGPDASGESLAGIDPLGAPSTGGTGFASYYLDDNDVQNNGVGDGFPDRNPIFGSLFVNAGDPAWFTVVDGMTIDGPDHLAGLREVLTSSYGRGLDCDGVFLDTIDTAAPNSYTSAQSANETKFEWTAPGFGAFIRHVHQAYPNKLILQNRGLFFFDPRHPQYAFNARGAIDFLLFESFRLNSNTFEDYSPVDYPDNRYNVAPKLIAEANRPDGFRVLSLGYAEGPDISTATLTGGSTQGFDSLIEDIHVAQELTGFRHYLTDSAVRLVNDFVQQNASMDDRSPPVWTSTYNDHDVSPAQAPTPRVGIQKALGGNGRITVWWDVALDMNRVNYVLYAQPQPFDFSGDPTLSGAAHYLLTPTVPSDYVLGVGPDRYPYEATIAGFPSGQTQYLVIRAVDQSAAQNQDGNTVVLTATP
jgi:hypothetical protein